MRRERACKGCDGTGGHVGVIERHFGDSASDLRRVIVGGTVCPACCGTGRVTDHIPAADAVADAETLCVCGHAFRSHVRGYYVGPCRGRAINAPACKRIPAPCLCDAFRAVPGLRG